MRKSVLAMVLAGGEGTRLAPLTQQRAKPAVPFGGKYRIIDFVLSNFVNSGIESIFVLTQFRSQSLTEHIINGWNVVSTHGKNRFVIPVPAQMQTQDKRWYCGTADAIHQNMHLVKDFAPDLIAVFGGDHIYKMDVSQMVDTHIQKNAIATVAAIPVPLEEAKEFGVIQIDDEGRIIGFQEKPENPIPMPGKPDMALASMGNYIFNSSDLTELLGKDALDESSSHDFGKDILPGIVDTGRLFTYNFHENRVAGVEDTVQSWRDVGTLKAYYDANMDLKNPNPTLDLYNPKWPIYSYTHCLPPAKFVHNDEETDEGMARIGKAINSVISDGCIISGSSVFDSILYNSVRVHSYTTVRNSVILDDVQIGESCRINNAIIDKHVDLPPNTVIGYNREDDEKRFHVQDLDVEAGTWLTSIAKSAGVQKLQLPGYGRNN